MILPWLHHVFDRSLVYDPAVQIELGRLENSSVIANQGVGRKRHLPQIDILRGIAALAVVSFHLYTGLYLHAELRPLFIFNDLKLHTGFWRWIAVPCVFGYAGVPLFFVISGFCIHYSFLRSRRPFAWFPFLGRRFWRIYPAYLAAIALSLLLPGNLIWRTHHLPKTILFHLLFLHNLNQTTIFELSPPFWTLAVEFQFYLAYPLFLAIRKHWGIYAATLVSFCLCATLSTAFHRGLLGHSNLLLLPLMYWVQWCLGALIAEHFDNGKPPLLPLPLALLLWLLGILFAVPISAYAEWNYLGWAVLGAVIIERVIRRGSRITSDTLTSWPTEVLIWLGTISYSIYLLHAMILGLLLPHIPLTSSIRFPVAVASTLTTVIMAAATSYYLIEKPGIKVGRVCLAWCFGNRQ